MKNSARRATAIDRENLFFMVRDYIKALGYREGKRIGLFGVLLSSGKLKPAAGSADVPSAQRAKHAQVSPFAEIKRFAFCA
jgi:hypothetical protein